MLNRSFTTIKPSREMPREKCENNSEVENFRDKCELFDLLKVTGRYSVWLADGRLMIVEYTADLKNGYVPKISFINNANPIG
jgi:hypothetical protein